MAAYSDPTGKNIEYKIQGARCSVVRVCVVHVRVYDLRARVRVQVHACARACIRLFLSAMQSVSEWRVSESLSA